MIEHKFIPDGLTQLPSEARDHEVLAVYLEAAEDIPADSDDPIESWRDIKRKVPGHGEHMVLRLPDTAEDYSSTTLDAIVEAIESNVTGLKAHPGGWTEIETEEGQQE